MNKNQYICPICDNLITQRNNCGDYICCQDNKHFVIVRGRTLTVETLFLYLGDKFKYECVYIYDSDTLLVRYREHNENIERKFAFDSSHIFYPKTTEDLLNFLLIS